MTHHRAQEIPSFSGVFLSYLGVATSAIAGFGLVSLPTILQTDPSSVQPENDDGAGEQAILPTALLSNAVAPIAASVEWAPEIDTSQIFLRAQELRESSRFRAAYDMLAQIPAYHSDYEKSQALMEDDATQILKRALDKYEQGKPDIAIKYLQAIPEAARSFNIAQAYLNTWQL